MSYIQHYDSDPSPAGPKPSSGLTPVMVALSFTTILIQVQAAAQGNVRDLLPILIAALLTMAGVARSLKPQPLYPKCSEPEGALCLNPAIRVPSGSLPCYGRPGVRARAS
jgi:hypothetical protein